MLCRGVRTRWGFHLNWKKMASNFKVHLASQWMLERTTGERLALGEAMRLLAAIEAPGHIAGACRICGVSYRDRKSVGLGKSVSVRVELGGRCFLKKKN